MIYIQQWPGGRKQGKTPKISIGNEGDTGSLNQRDGKCEQRTKRIHPSCAS
jgi:hypothetical protein